MVFINFFGILLQLHQPRYASCLFFELYESEQPYIQILYKKSSKTKKLYTFNIPNCGTKCPLNKFYQLYQHILPTQSFDKECQLHDGETLLATGNPENAPY